MSQIVRYRKALSSRTYVLIGVGSEADDEVWTKSRALIRGIRRSLDGWYSTYLSARGLRVERYFLPRREIEVELCRGLTLGGSKFWFSLFELRVAEDGLATERVFNHLVEAGVLRHPSARSFSPVATTDPGSKNLLRKRPISRQAVWQVDEAAADAWAATRLLLLEDNR